MLQHQTIKIMKPAYVVDVQKWPDFVTKIERTYLGIEELIAYLDQQVGPISFRSFLRGWHSFSSFVRSK